MWVVIKRSKQGVRKKQSHATLVERSVAKSSWLLGNWVTFTSLVIDILT